MLDRCGIHFEDKESGYLRGTLLDPFENRGVETADLMGAFRKELARGTPLDEFFWMRQNFHCRPRGYRVFAEEVAKYLLEHPPYPSAGHG